MATPQGPPPPFQGQPTPEQIAEMQRRFAADAAANGMTVPEFIEFVKKKQAEAMASQQQAQAEAQQQQQTPIAPGPPKPEALALASFLQSQDLKMRTCILNGQRKNMFKGE